MNSLDAIFEELTRIDAAFTDERGEIANILSGVPVTHIAICHSLPGTVRGNHWHPDGTGDQYMYVIGGRYVAYARDARGGPLSAQVVGPRMLAKCPPGVAHAYWFVEETVFLNIGTDSRETERFEEHTRDYTLIDATGRPLDEHGPVRLLVPTDPPYLFDARPR